MIEQLLVRKKGTNKWKYLDCYFTNGDDLSTVINDLNVSETNNEYSFKLLTQDEVEKYVEFLNLIV